MRVPTRCGLQNLVGIVVAFNRVSTCWSFRSTLLASSYYVSPGHGEKHYPSRLWSISVDKPVNDETDDSRENKDDQEEALFAPTPTMSSTSPPDVMSLWKRRLITNEDPLSIHKISAIGYSLSSAALLGVGGVRFLTDFFAGANVQTAASSFAVIPDFLNPISQMFTFTNIIMCIVSVPMALQHRQGDLTARNAFLGVALSSLFSGFFFLWVSPFAPEAFNNNLFSGCCFAVLIVLNTLFIMDTLFSIPEVVEGRRDRKSEREPPSGLQFTADALGYVLPIAWGLPVIGATGYQLSVLHDRLWFLDYCSLIEHATGMPLRASVFYLQVAASLGASYGALFVTLRDKRLISKHQEVVGITVFSVPPMIWTIFVTTVFYQNFGLLTI